MMPTMSPSISNNSNEGSCDIDEKTSPCDTINAPLGSALSMASPEQATPTRARPCKKLKTLTPPLPISDGDNTSAFPSFKSSLTTHRAMSPNIRVSGIMASYGLPTRLDSVSLEALQYFEPYVENQFPPHMLQIVRTGNIIRLQKLCTASQLRLHTQFGESLIHVICKWRSIPNAVDIVRWLLDEVDLPLNTRDRHGRTVLHATCMSAAESTRRISRDVQFGLVRLVLERAPELLLFEDNQGKTPLDLLSFQEHEAWNTFLDDRVMEAVVPHIRESMASRCNNNSDVKDLEKDDLVATLMATYTPKERAAHIMGQVEGILYK